METKNEGAAAPRPPACPYCGCTGQESAYQRAAIINGAAIRAAHEALGDPARSVSLSGVRPTECWFVSSLHPLGAQGCAKPAGHLDPHIPFCPANLTVRSIPHTELHCNLADGHSGPHRSGSSEWTSEQPAAGPSEAVPLEAGRTGNDPDYEGEDEP